MKATLTIRCSLAERQRHESARDRIRQIVRTAVMMAILLSLAIQAWPQQKSKDFTGQSLEDLMNIEVTSVSKKEQKLSNTAAAIFVITQEEIRRSGATNIPDLLRAVPGLNVAQINANIWAVSARGFDGEFSNKLLVMLDGRSVYTQNFDGVFWDVLDLPFEDIDRIEVIRGPGGSVWGANAVNGVINIVTKKSADTHGGLVVAGGGNVDQGFGTVQYGGSLGKSTDYRVFTKYFGIDHMQAVTGGNGGDGWEGLRAGFRTDTKLSHNDDLSFDGDIYSDRTGDVANIFPSFASPTLQKTFSETDVDGGYVNTNWNHRFSALSDTTLQISFDRYKRSDVLDESRATFNIDFAHHFAWGTRQDIVWGLGYRYSSATTNGDLTFSLNPRDLNTNLFSLFVQDEFALVPNKLSLTIGTKLEHNYYTGFGLMPSVRVAWNMRANQMLWAAISRAIRTPSRVDTASQTNVGGFVPPDGPPIVFRIVGDPAFQDEDLVAYEAGYRTQIFGGFSIDLAAYYDSYSHLQTSEPSTPLFEVMPAPPHIVMPLMYANLMHGETHGLEVSGNWKVASHWTLAAGYSFQQIHLHLDRASADTQSVASGEGSTPDHWARLASHVNLSHNVEWDASANFVNRLTSPIVPSYTRIDTQVMWNPRENLSFSVVGQNLASDRHLEFLNPEGTGVATLVKRSAYGKLSWRF